MKLPRRLLTVALTVGALTFSAPSPAGAKVATGCAKTYTVKRNDSWSKIADKVSVSMQLLLKVNKSNAKTTILIGDVICLPRAAVTAAAPPKGLQLPPPAKRYSTKQAAAIIREIFPDHLEARALAIAKRESNLNPAAYSWCCVGLFQLNWNPHKKWLNDMGIGSPQELLDPYVNVRAALQLYKRSNGWGPWE
jgi:LysM repeat protein